MSRVFLDTSAAYALLVSTDSNHPRAAAAFRRLEARAAAVITTSYVLVETCALLGRRVGRDAVRAFHEDVEPLLEVVWVGADLHESGMAWLLERERGDVSLVDAVSFLVIRGHAVGDVFAYDRHFEREGFSLLP